MEIKNILKTGYKALVVTVTLIEAFELGKNLIDRCNKKTVGVSDTAVDTNDVESALTMRVKFERQPLSDGPYKRSYSDYRLAYGTR